MISTPTLTRRQFVKAGGALVVSASLPSLSSRGSVEAAGSTLDATKLASWIEIHDDGRLLVRTGKIETGTGMSAFYAQVVAEELRVRPEVISLVLGHTDETPDGGFSAGFLTGANNLRKVAAYTYQALLDLAAGALNAPKDALAVTDGVVSGGGRRISYAGLVRGQRLELTIPIGGSLPALDPGQPTGLSGLTGLQVSGTPPTREIPQYSVIGESFPVPTVAERVRGDTEWVGDVRLPGMLHARMVRPSAVGATLVRAGSVDRARFPNAEVVTKGNLVAVVSPDEWEAVAAARAVAASTTWSDWSGLPGHDEVTATLRAQPWGAPSHERGDAAKVSAALSAAAKTVEASYEQPFTRHAPMGAYVAVADVRRDGSATVHTASAQSQGLRVQIAHALGVDVEKVVVRWHQGPAQYGRTTWGGDGAEGDAAILSQLVGSPVRVQWTIQEDLAWSTVSPAWVADVKGALDTEGRLSAVHSDWYAPHENDARLLGALLAGAPSVTPLATNRVSTVWAYEKIPVLERAFAMPSLGADATSAGLRGNIMRTPWQRQQNFATEALINEAAAAAGADPIQYRIDHTTNPRLIELLRATAKEAGWDPRPSPRPGARRTGGGLLAGRGVAVMIRSDAPWVAIAEVTVAPDTGEVRVTRFTVGLDCGKVMNPRQLRLTVQGGIVQGLGEALTEEVTFDRQKVTSTDWTRYRIPTMGSTPDIRMVITSYDDRGINSAGEAPNALPPPAVAAAIFDATGVPPRRIPLTAAYVKKLLSA
ncbi:MAG: xanthine dehydrogenase family protein molybdopterin-binding subunit [Acidimicrobiia bacterium]|nr:xanthine dehydrogenase family protein molybdopterin-binding subunit [Acidimicrobiia bacterium]